MFGRKALLAAAMIAAMAAGMPAQAEDPERSDGHNTGDDGVISIVFDTLGGGHGMVSAGCEFHQQNIRNNDAVLFYYGHAEVLPRDPDPNVFPPAVLPVAVGVKCTIKDKNNPSIVFDYEGAIPGLAGGWLKPQARGLFKEDNFEPEPFLESSAWHVCVEVSVKWSDNTYTENMGNARCAMAP